MTNGEMLIALLAFQVVCSAALLILNVIQCRNWKRLSELQVKMNNSTVRGLTAIANNTSKAIPINRL